MHAASGFSTSTHTSMLLESEVSNRKIGEVNCLQNVKVMLDLDVILIL